MNGLLSVSILSFVFLLAQWAQAAAQTCSKQSPAHTVALLELYTSEGCSSCPPADRFVSGLRDDGFTPEQVVPLSLHVDYWDHIGWKDIFADHRHTERQHWLSGLAKSSFVYTPEIFIGGRETRNWRNGAHAAIRRINGQPAKARIDMRIGQPGNGSLQVDISAEAPRDARLFVALYENGLASEVKAGENRGVRLRHDYVVRDWIGPVGISAAGGRILLPRPLALPAGAKAGNLGVVAFVQAEQGDVLQALALPLCTN
ncbi:DUF1223 domain-containing protein [Herbaspirillum sp. HC18]|nr:DUF1223 domain-containing protein [Herbaspirillum sp. HC18]